MEGTNEQECDHPLDLHGMCVLCGVNLEDLLSPLNERGNERPLLTTTSTTRIEITHDISRGLRASSQESHRMYTENVRDLLNQKKLSLVIDLDQTILHATVDPTVLHLYAQRTTTMENNEEEEEEEEKNEDEGLKREQRQSVFDQIVTLNLPTTGTHYVKFRPGLLSFLEKCQQLFEMHVYTMGSREYAEAVVYKIDPTHQYFGDRILSRDDNQLHAELGRKSLRRIFPHSDRTVLVVDDRGDVWDWGDNLIIIEPFKYYISARQQQQQQDFVEGQQQTPEYITQRINALNLDESEEALRLTKERLQDIHSRYFFSSNSLQGEEGDERDVKVFAREIKHEVLKDCKFCFTGLASTMTPQEHPLWKMAISFGAQCSTSLDTSCSHLIALVNSSPKVFEAVTLNIPIVNPEWLIQSVHKWHPVDVVAFIVTPPLERSNSWIRRSLDQQLLQEIANEFIYDPEEEQTTDIPEFIYTEDDEDDDESERESKRTRIVMEENLEDIRSSPNSSSISISSSYVDDLVDELDLFPDDEEIN